MLIWQFLLITLPPASILFWFLVLWFAAGTDHDSLAGFSIVMILGSIAITAAIWLCFLINVLCDIGLFEQIASWLKSELPW